MPHARNADPQTSHEAAATVRDTAPLKGRILELFAQFGDLTDEQLIEEYEARPDFPPATHSGIRSRRAELVYDQDRPQLWATLFEGRTKTGRRCTVWSAVDPFSTAA